MHKLVFSGISAKKSDGRRTAHLESPGTGRGLDVILAEHEVTALMDRNSSPPYFHETPYGCAIRITDALGASFRLVEFFLSPGNELTGRIVLSKPDGTRAEVLCRPFDALMLASCMKIPMLATLEALAESKKEILAPAQEKNPDLAGKIMKNPTVAILRSTGGGEFELVADNLNLGENLAEQISQVLQNKISMRVLPPVKVELNEAKKKEQEKNLAEMLRKMTPETHYKM